MRSKTELTSETLLAFESKNPVFGRTLNPFDHARTPGGSSGGEAALVSLKGTPVGWGSDSKQLPGAVVIGS